MIDRSHDLPIAKQAKALGISRGSIYYLPRPVSAADLAVMRRMDEWHCHIEQVGAVFDRGEARLRHWNRVAGLSPGRQ